MSDHYFTEGLHSLQIQNYYQAVIDFTNSLKLKESSSRYANRAVAYMHLKKFEFAKVDYGKSIAITSELMNKLDEKNTESINLGLRDIIGYKSTIASIELDQNNFIEAEEIYNELIELYFRMNNQNILPQYLHIYNVYLNRGFARLKMKKMEKAAVDFAYAYFNANALNLKKDIEDFAKHYGISEKYEIAKSRINS